MRHTQSLPTLMLLLATASWSVAQSSNPPEETAEAKPEKRHCLILVGIPGDAQHQQSFGKLLTDLRGALRARGVADEEISVLQHGLDDVGDQSQPISPEAIKSTIAGLCSELSPQDSFWMFFIGHADHDGQHARFHIPGPDLRAVDYAELLDPLECKEQILWLTMGSSGWFTEALSQSGRIVITATSPDAEPNETEFPTALLSALKTEDTDLDTDDDGDVSVLELFSNTHLRVEEIYLSDQRAATEHATLEDQGDGKAAEWKQISDEIERISKITENDDAEIDPSVAFGQWKTDGHLASTVFLPLRIPPASRAPADQPDEESGSSETPTDSDNGE